MILLQSILIEDFRGIKKLDLAFNGKSFAVCGRNGTGKSGVVDAIEFVLTGDISRLSGEGTDELSVKKHAPHVDSRDAPDNARVTLVAKIAATSRTFTIMRSVGKSAAPTVAPADPDVLSVLEQIEEHPELVLTRREIIRYVLATDGNRAKEVQIVLKLDRLDHVRSALTTIANSATKDAKAAKRDLDTAIEALTKAVGITKLAVPELLAAVNQRRDVLALPPLPALTATSSFKDGLSTPTPAVANTPVISKAAATADLKELRDLLGRLSTLPESPEFKRAIGACSSLLADPETLRGLSSTRFLEDGLALVDGSRCPFCDNEWDPEALRAHVREKLKALESARAKKVEAETALESTSNLFSELARTLTTAAGYARRATPAQDTAAIQEFTAQLTAAGTTIESLLPLPDTLKILNAPPRPDAAALVSLTAIEQFVAALPEPSQRDSARDYLVIGQEKLEAYRRARRAKEKADAQAALAATVLATYGKTMDTTLVQLYKDVESNFAAMYGELNLPDEVDFQARLTPSTGKLGFGVNFYGRGFYPPGAYHSEGHQDAMGLCLYLALMRHVLKDNFRFAVLDDVLMSVDASHRRAVCTLLRTRFPNTQFILTTHDPVWLNHMRTEGLITSKTLVYFHSWDVSTGPALWDDVDVWDQIAKALQQDKVPVAAELLRNYLEYAAGELCHRLRARVEFRLDARMELGELLPPAYERLNQLFSKGKEAANSWGNTTLRDGLTQRHADLSSAKAATSIDQWQVNAAVHYNAWASLTRQDFEPLVRSFKSLLEAFRCSHCKVYLNHVRTSPTEESVGCPCTQGTFGLTLKP